ncbi:SHOCT domain-containing protein [Demequina sp.]|uniref:SHOCT domain-containing protein n=1 Tax=Demequina sp. TaxID=2050685 RepID=UPI0025D81473|nr:SHOCT domain-containing protein [Demequina sp.]
MPRRIGRPGLVGTMARTAVITGTATAVSGNVARRQAGKAQAQAQAQQPQYVEAAPAPAPQVAAPAPSAGGDLMAQLTQLAQMNAAGILDDAEFAAAKAKLLG